MSRVQKQFYKSFYFWVLVFGVWFVFMSGFFTKYVSSPGLLQAWELNSLLDSKQKEIETIEANLEMLEKERDALINDPMFQEKTIRKVLGYIAKDEIIFDFASHRSSKVPNLQKKK